MPNILYQKSSPRPEDDLVLFQEIAQGNRLAFERFYVKYYQYLCRFALSYEKDLYLVEEKVSDVFYYIWQKKEELSKIENPKVYVFTMTKNMLFQQKKITRKTMLDLEFESVEHKHYVSTIEDDIIQSEQEADLRQALLRIIDKIPPKSRRIFEMSRIDGLKYQQIADILDLSVKTIESHMHIALKTIALALTQTNKTK
ncbi:sigma-70 family RNA polymerase sigma factor [Myroides odoratus]|uniref:sigma-70 family RNA polymerase sigma factor n=1 Tax=Myroides odoratus TaxID=256 RepID=UPI00216A8949|nr:sigma-70 family RNA polymerase sigma factor [Myroides odoratus]MCS4238008.1 RNA polymerase sigma-70 factor (ECF subfamily) [Myroides odoratus]